MYPTSTVGLGAALISAMMLLANLGAVGLGTMLIGEISSKRLEDTRSLVATGMLMAAATSGGLGLVFAAGVSRLSYEFAPLAAGVGPAAMFTLGVSLTGVALVLDQALIGLLRGWLRFWRNTVFSLAKLAALVAAGIWLANSEAIVIYGAWTVGIVLSLTTVVSVAAFKGTRTLNLHPNWQLLRPLGTAAGPHYGLNLSLLAPGFAMPILVTTLFSSTINAGFYVAWMIVMMVFSALAANTTVLYAIGAANEEMLAERARFTFKLSLVVGLVSSATLLLFAKLILYLFGPQYAELATNSLRILALGILPVIVKMHYVAVCQVRKRISATAREAALGAVMQMVFAGLGAQLGGLSGLCLGWVVAIYIEAAYAAPTVFRLLYSRESAQVIASNETAGN